VTPAPAPGSDWQRLHPLSPVVGMGGLVLALLVLLAGTESSGGRSGNVVVYLALVPLVIVLGVVRWLVTRWKLDGVTLRIETGLLRRDSRQLPLARIQAVDVVRPFLARLLGMAELRIRLAGSNSAHGRLAYLSEPAALDLRARLLAGHHGLDLATPEPEERPIATVPTERLVAATLVSSGTVVTVVAVAFVVLLTQVSKAAAAAIGGTAVIYLLGLIRVTWRRVSDQYGFSIGQAADGIRIRRGLLATVAETIPLQRVQAVRKIQPLLWRPFGWCRLEVDIAGAPGREQGTRSASVTRALLPVGAAATADVLMQTLVGITGPTLVAPPARVRWKAPLSYHFLAAGRDDSLAASSTGRLRKTTTWIPLEKVQSIRRVQGPVQRALSLATVHVDAAGRRVRAEFRDRDVGEADALFDRLTATSRAARRLATRRAEVAAAALRSSATTAGPTDLGPSTAAAVPAGWYVDPSRRHQLRFWDGNNWTAHVNDDGAAGADPL
jgi:putative membrane protein